MLCLHVIISFTYGSLHGGKGGVPGHKPGAFMILTHMALLASFQATDDRRHGPEAVNGFVPVLLGCLMATLAAACSPGAADNQSVLSCLMTICPGICLPQQCSCMYYQLRATATGSLTCLLSCCLAAGLTCISKCSFRQESSSFHQPTENCSHAVPSGPAGSSGVCAVDSTAALTYTGTGRCWCKHICQCQQLRSSKRTALPCAPSRWLQRSAGPAHTPKVRLSGILAMGCQAVGPGP
jgi:hypothetical protein